MQPSHSRPGSRDNLGLDRDECLAYVERSTSMFEFRKTLFSRIVPTVKDIGLWGPKVQAAYQAMGVIDFASLSPDALAAADDAIAEDFDAAARERKARA